jgi:hypothetical protein
MPARCGNSGDSTEPHVHATGRRGCTDTARPDAAGFARN